MTQKAKRRGSDRKDSIIKAILAARVKSSILPDRAAIRRFLKQYFADVPVEDLTGRSPTVMASIALAHLELGSRRRKGQVRLRLYNPTEDSHGYQSPYTFLELINDDMPFLVDSVAAAVGRHDLAVQITVHPIIRVVRDGKGALENVVDSDSYEGHRESFIRLAFDRQADPAALKALTDEVRTILADVRLAVRDWQRMRKRMLKTAELMGATGPYKTRAGLLTESQEFLRWCADNHFTYLGYRQYELTASRSKTVLKPVPGSGMGILGKDSNNTMIELTPEMRRLARSKEWLILTKANSRSTIHRNAYLDYIGVKIFDEKGEACGEHRFIGLFASAAYSENPRNIPLLRHKITRILNRAKVDPGGHRGKALLHIIDTYPRDELFHATTQDLARTTIGILNLQDRQRVRFFLRRDTFRRFFSCLVYVPRDKYTTAVRRRIEAILIDALSGESVDSSVQISDSALARLHLVVRTPGSDRPRISIQRIEAALADAIVTWEDRLGLQLSEEESPDVASRLIRSWRGVFPPGYQHAVAVKEACSDIRRIEEMLADGVERSVDLYAPEGSQPGHMHFMVYSRQDPLVLSDALPVLEDMGVDVYTERPFELKLPCGDAFWIQDFHLRHEDGGAVDVESAARRFEECFMRVLRGQAESDGLNRLILTADLDARQTTLLRCYTKYLQQLGMPFSQAYMEDVLVRHPACVKLLVEQFEARFDPALRKSARQDQLKRIEPALKRALGKAANVDEDRILSAYAASVGSTLRSNYFQRDADGHIKTYLSIKLDPTGIREVPLPRPKFEIFVFSPEVEGVHLRGGRIARGGLRWSDRREDFRTEILGLMKAQVVKNTVIVPTGAKGGFFPKRPPSGDRDAVLANAIECYKTFIRGLLDITDNVIDGKVIPPADVVRRDSDDPYLVVAADKGTATFSDIANGLSADYDFWLDDAFASGGSAGYDHKKMGITARGAWEAVKRHFLELGLNTQKDPFTVAAIGDMSGDVFGNGMLLSRKIRLVAAFNHLHIFIDPDPDTASSYRERRRLFRKPRSGWADYNTELISRGGGIFSRQSKTIRLSPQMRELLGVSDAAMQPDQLIRAILAMPVDLLWNGGIGTYVKASSEGHSDVGDRANDAVRVNANRLRCRVVGEGGNLGLTQLARIEFSQHGGRINTDFIDNSGGVDSSDREVNIKILLGEVCKQKNMSRDKRDELLASMTDDVADLVLRNNYLQTQSISMSEVRSVERIDEIARLIATLEKDGVLNRGLEFLPDETEIEDRRIRKQGFTRPELAVVLSYAKIDLYDGLIESGQSLEDFLAVDPPRYFPQVLRQRYNDFLPTHRLSREILATLIANDIVNRMGPAFVRRTMADTGADVVTVARAYTVAHQICGAGPLLETIEAQDHKIPAAAQVQMMFEVSRSLRHVCYWLIDRFGERLNIAISVERLKPGMHAIYTRTGKLISEPARARHEAAAAEFVAMGAPEALAQQMSALLLTRPALDMADLAARYKPDVLDITRLYALFNGELGIYWLHVCAEDLQVHGRWQAAARGNLRDEMFRMRRELAVRLLKDRGRRNLVKAAEEWLSERQPQVERFEQMIAEMKLRGQIDFATLSVAARELRELIISAPAE